MVIMQNLTKFQALINLIYKITVANRQFLNKPTTHLQESELYDKSLDLRKKSPKYIYIISLEYQEDYLFNNCRLYAG